MKTHIATTIHPSEVFPNTVATIENITLLLKEISLLDGIFWCARLNRIATHNELSLEEKTEYFLKMFFDLSNLRSIATKAIFKPDFEKRILFFRGQILFLLANIIKHSIVLPGDGTTFSAATIQVSFAKALLISGDIWAKRNWFVLENNDPTKAISRFRALPGFRKNLEATRSLPNPSRFLGRGWGFFSKIMPLVMPGFQDEVEAAIGMTTVEYYICLCILFSHFLLPKNDNSIFNPKTFGEEKKIGKSLQNFFKLHSTSIEELTRICSSDSTDSLYNSLANHLRDKPILVTSDERAVILDPLALANLASVGYLFRLPSRLLPKAFETFGKCIEKYSETIFRQMFPVFPESPIGRIQFGYKGQDSNGRNFEFDAILDDPEVVVIFEVKAAFLPEERIIESEPEKMHQILIERYVKKPSGSAAGIGQLARLASGLAKKEVKRPIENENRLKTIIPVLVVWDEFLGSPGIGEFFQEEFVKLLGLSQIEKGSFVINEVALLAPIVLTIEDLENLERSVQEFSIQAVLFDYSRNSPDRFLSFHDYLAQSKFKGTLRSPTIPADFGRELFELAIQGIHD